MQLTIQGDLDLAGVTATRAELFSHLTGAGPIILDLRPTSYLASAGVSVLTELADKARQAGIDLRIRTDPDGVIQRILTLTGLDRVLPVMRTE